ncbi:MAG: acyl-CoA dehydrogenase family protein [Deltaproteobacteria bacterium]|nr:acyl-CoA dehydrogenase family protein [Deltaproteobacteria bacterium]MBW2397203.1 acyl-CoA dehydrogenase family protein [Deltaproteobacteria bacterium]
MALVLSEEQQFLRDTAAEFLDEKSPVTHLRELRDGKEASGFSRPLWKEMSELGWAGILVPEEYGGSGLGFAELGVVIEECGRRLSPYPLLSTVVLGASAVLLGGSESQRKDILPGVCAGETILALASQEQGRFHPYQVESRAERSGDGYRITGEKKFVLDGHVADQLIVVARTAGNPGGRDGLTLFLVDSAVAGLEIKRSNMVDSRNAARVRLDGVEVGADRVLGEVGAGAEILDPLHDRACVALSAELLGISLEVFERTVEYLKTREQFGVLIGSFQGLKHRAAEMFCELELAKSIVLDALRAIDEKRLDSARLASAAKARTSDAASLVTREGVQMHGGIGMTDEEEIGLFLKRAKAAELSFGDAAFHRDCFAGLMGF